MAGHGDRNDRLVDPWSIVHLLTGVGMGWIMDPFWALLIMILWEPVELYVISPITWRLMQREFGHESLANSWSDILFDAAGVTFGAFLLRLWLEPPFILFAP